MASSSSAAAGGAAASVAGAGAELHHDDAESTQKVYVDRKYFSSLDEQVQALRGSRSLYVGNLSFYTTEAQVHQLFSAVAPVRRVIMGLNRSTKTPCGFCFVEYYVPEAALAAISTVSGTALDDRIIRCELDFGFKEGRQYGRGMSGGQVRDERRETYDADRGGIGPQAAQMELALPSAVGMDVAA